MLLRRRSPACTPTAAGGYCGADTQDAMTHNTQTSATTDRAHGPWVWVGSTRTSAFTAFSAACLAAGVEITDAQDPRATAWVIDMLTAAALSPALDGPGRRPPRLLLASSAEDAVVAQAQLQPGDEVGSLDASPELIVARLMRMERRPR